MGIVQALCISEKKGTPKKRVEQVSFVEGEGIISDAHRGAGHRQVSLLAAESIARVKEKMPTLADGAFAENIITKGLELNKLKINDHIKIGNVILEVTQLGKECHAPCVIQKTVGECIMPKEGVFAKVLRGGSVIVGDEISVSFHLPMM